MRYVATKVFAKDEAGGGGNPDPTMTSPAGKPGGENVPPAGGESMAPADSKHPHPKPGEDEPGAGTDEQG